MRTALVSLLIFLLFSPAQFAGAIENRVLAGTGEVRYLGFITVYSAELYVDRQVLSLDEMPADFSKCLVLRYNVAISADDIIRGADAVLKRQHPEARLAELRDSIDLLHRSYRDVEDGDSYSLCYDAATGVTELAFNGRQVVSLHSREFAELYFGIWLSSNQPIDKSLRDNLLASLTRG